MASQSLTVAEFIELPIVKAGLPELVAGEEGIGAEVRWVHPLDVPDVSDLLRGGEMILTTGVSIGEDAASAQEIMDNELVNSTTAAQNGDIYYVDSQAWYLAGVGLESLAQILADVEQAFVE